MFGSEKISFSLSAQPLANFIAALIVLIAPFLLSWNFVSSMEAKTGSHVEKIDREIALGLKALSGKPSTQPEGGSKDPRAKCKAATGLSENQIKLCSLLWKVNKGNELVSSELIMVAATAFGILLFAAILFSRLAIGVFVVVLCLALARGYFANDYVQSVYMKIEAVHQILTNTLMDNAVSLGLIGSKVKSSFHSSIEIGGLFGWTASAFLIFTLACLCLRGNGARWFDPEELRRRRTTVLFVGALASFLYAIAVYRLTTLVNWPSELLELNRDSISFGLLGKISETYVNNLALLFSLEVIVMMGIVVLVLNQDVNRAATENGAGDDATTWREQQGLSLTATKILTPFIAAIPVAAPTLLNFANWKMVESFMGLFGN